MAVDIKRTDLSASDLRREAAQVKNARASRRMLALAPVLDGKTRTEAAQSCGMDRQTLRVRVHRYRAEGLAGLVDRPLSGRLGAEQMRQLAVIVETGPVPSREGVVHRRRIDPCGVVEQRFGIRVAERTMGAILHRLGLARLSARPRLPQCDADTQAVYKNTAELARAAVPDEARANPLEIRFQDEVRAAQQGTLTRMWARKGTRPRAPKHCR